MASGKHYRDGIGTVDVAMVVSAFEAINNLQVEVRLSVADRHGAADVVIVALASRRDVPIGEAPPLASVQLSCSDSNLTTLDAAIIHALYLLDSRLAKNEMLAES